MKFADLHIHPDYSFDARGTIEEYSIKAIERGLSQICFTTHIDLDLDRNSLDPFIRINGRIEFVNRRKIISYIDEVRKNSDKYRDKIDIHSGLEIGWNNDHSERIAEFLYNLPVDFKIGSVHCLDKIAVTSKIEALIYLKNNGIKNTAIKYFTELTGAAKSGLFDVLGHIDGYKKYAPILYPQKFEYINEEMVKTFINACIENNVTFELNTASLRKQGHSEFYPSNWILKIAKDLGIKKLSTGSDSHCPNDVGFQFDKAYHTLNEFGFEPYYIE